MTHRRLTAGITAAALTLSACGNGTDADTGSGSNTPVQGGTLVYAVNTEPTNLDPHASPQDITGLYARPVLDSLVSLDAKGGIHPWLATSWQISTDQKSYTFKLRQGVKFSDGTVFDAAAVKANLDHIVDPKTKSQLAASFIAPYTGSEVVNPQTVKVNFSRPYSPFLAALATAYFGIESPASLKQGPDALAKKIVGSGPFIIDQFTPHQGITYHRNPDYDWGPEGASHKGPALLQKLEIKVLSEDSVRLGALTSGQVNGIASVPPVNVKQIKADSRFTVITRQAPGGNYNYYPNTTGGPFADVRVRQAFRDGIDFKTIIDKLYFGVFQPAFSAVSPSTPGYDKATETQWKYDPAESARLLDAAGWATKDSQGYRTKGGRRLTIRWPFLKSFSREQRDVLAQQVQAEAKKAGFDVVFTDITANNYVAKFAAGDYDLADFSWQRADGDALRNLFSSASLITPQRFGQNIARYSDKQVDGWLDQALSTTDLTKRADLYAKTQQKTNAEAVVFPVYVFNYVLGASKKTHGIQWEPQAYPTFYDAWVSK
jgi:peptide/nickel transport system substrate-binding protein